MWKFEEPP